MLKGHGTAFVIVLLSQFACERTLACCSDVITVKSTNRRSCALYQRQFERHHSQYRTFSVTHTDIINILGQVGPFVRILQSRGGWWPVHLDTGFVCSSKCRRCVGHTAWAGLSLWLFAIYVPKGRPARAHLMNFGGFCFLQVSASSARCPTHPSLPAAKS